MLKNLSSRIYHWLRRKNYTKLRNPEEIFEKGDVFKATDNELENIIKNMASKAIPNPIARDREMIRALVISNVQNQRLITTIENRNLILTIIIVGLTMYNIYLARIQVSPIISEQIRNERQAYNFCKESGNENLGWPSATGGEISCEQVLKMLDVKFKN